LTFLRIGMLAVALSTGVTLAFAAGGRTGGRVAKAPSCLPSEVWDRVSGNCAKKTGTLDDKQLYQKGRDLALAGRFDDALSALNAVKSPDSMMLTMIGYATGRLGNRDLALAYYHMALAADPNNVDAHEHLAQAYAEDGQAIWPKANSPRLPRSSTVRRKRITPPMLPQNRPLAEHPPIPAAGG
jgi:tetratricopeptide (TPR) repeat protein